MADVFPSGDINRMGFRGVAGGERKVVEGYCAEVGRFSGRDRTYLVIESKRLRSPKCRGAERGVRTKRRGIAAGALGEQGGKAHLAQEV